jgi:hypothetical protein
VPAAARWRPPPALVGAVKQPADGSVITCKGCGGTSVRDGSKSPDGWLSLTVSVPPSFSEKGYLWLGQYCSMACLASSVPELDRDEQLARQAYDPVPPDQAR